MIEKNIKIVLIYFLMVEVILVVGYAFYQRMRKMYRERNQIFRVVDEILELKQKTIGKEKYITWDKDYKAYTR